MTIAKIESIIGSEEGDGMDLFFDNGYAVRVLGKSAYLFEAQPGDDLDELAFVQMEV